MAVWYSSSPRNHPKATGSLLVDGQEAVGFHALASFIDA